ncbi:bacteriocin biosynthesis cyclodehydratase domain-containing protein [Agreia bicolorata]|uniref:Bacteriocin biosynthesis cyclodehydratase domain-containing protein n=1 Tax=Agreia bicolorata TaxID=110935 RepID=A0A1T4YD78_9MICO|nr:bacteriocin biosynthesis cyclodehydratase domain-containing protein [Agreia bicolorata]
MALQIDPRYPVLWRTPSSMQIGADRSIVTLHDVTVAEEHLVAVLRKGISQSGLDMIGETVGASPDDVADLLLRVRPALRRHAASARGLEGTMIAITGPTVGADAIRSVLAGLGAGLVDSSEPADLAIIVSTFSTDPRQSGTWLRRDIPHLAVVFGDSEVRIGPLVEPGSGPCLHCIERARIDDDPSWPALAGQLLGRRAHTEDPLTVSTVTPLVARAVLDRLAPDTPRSRRLRLRSRASIVDGQTGDIEEKKFSPHADCACQGVPPAENATAAFAESDPSPTPSTTARAGGARG